MQIKSETIQFKKKFVHGLYDFEVDSSWLEGIEYFHSNEEHYKSYDVFYGKEVKIVPITQINHKIRNNDTQIFNDKDKIVDGVIEKITSKERTLKILCGFDNGQKIKPIIVRIDDGTDECENLYKVIDGCHRLHCSIIYGFKKIPIAIYEKDEVTPCSD